MESNIEIFDTSKGKKTIISFVFFTWYFSLIIYFGRTVFHYAPWTSYLQLYVDIVDLWFIIWTINKINTFHPTIQKLIKSILLLLIIHVVYFLFAPDAYYAYGGEDRYIPLIGELKLVIFSLGAFFPVFYFSIKGYMYKRIFVFLIVLGVVLAIGSLYFYSIYLMEVNSNFENVNNFGYAILALAPFVMLFDKKYQFAYLLLSIMVTLFSAKRGAIFLSGILFLYILYKTAKSLSFVRKILLLIFVLIIAAIILYYTYDYYSLIIDRFSNQGMDSSGRDDIWRILFEKIFEEGPIAWIFGSGFGASIKLSGCFAHNDWMEIFADFGLIGVIVYFSMYKNFYKISKGLKNIKVLYEATTLSLICMLVNTTMQMSIYLIDTALYVFILGFVSAKFNNHYYTKDNLYFLKEY